MKHITRKRLFNKLLTATFILLIMSIVGACKKENLPVNKKTKVTIVSTDYYSYPETINDKNKSKFNASYLEGATIYLTEHITDNTYSVTLGKNGVGYIELYQGEYHFYMKTHVKDNIRSEGNLLTDLGFSTEGVLDHPEIRGEYQILDLATWQQNIDPEY